MDKNEMAHMSGESNYRRPKRLILDEIKIDGTNGNFVKTLFTKPKDNNGKFESEDLGQLVEVVFLKIRRKLTEFDRQRGLVRNTNEHNTSKDTVMMFGDNAQRGVASDLREKFPLLRTNQIIYAIEKKTGQIVRVIAKGASLGSESTRKGALKFYDYLQSFENEEHTWEYVTKLIPEQEKSKLGTYYCTTFSKGEKLTDEQLTKVQTAMKTVFDHVNAEDSFYKNEGESKLKKAEATDDVETIEYPDEEINAEDIPF